MLSGAYRHAGQKWLLHPRLKARASGPVAMAQPSGRSEACRRTGGIAIALAAAIVLLLGAGCGSGNDLLLATTTSTRDSGLLDVLAPAFEEATGYHVKIIAVGSGAAMAMGVFLAAGGLEEIGVASVAFLPPLGLRLEELPWLLTVPAAAAIIAWGTARFSVLSALRERY